MTMRMSKSATADFFKKAGQTYESAEIEVNTYTIHAISCGDKSKPALVFIHGSPGSWDAFKSYLVDKRLLEKYYLVSIDRPGFGYSDFGEAQPLAFQTALIHEALQKLKLKNISLVGHSMGGPIVCDLAAQHTERYDRIFVLSGSVDPAAEKPEKWRKIIKSKAVRYFVPTVLRASNDELFWLKTDLYDLENRLKNIVASVTVIHGTNDRLVPYANVEFMKKALKNAKNLNVITIDKADHFIPWTNYEEIVGAILAPHSQNK